jgi:hypothetical protein
MAISDGGFPRFEANAGPSAALRLESNEVDLR